jgi:phosphomannomutase
MKPLKIGITGVRGIVGETFTPELAIAFAQAFGTYLDVKADSGGAAGRVFVCRDTRPSGPMVRSAVMAGLLATGCDAVDLGICPTPTMQLAVNRLNAAGGVSITAGHNPAPWNALKFVRGDGLYLNVTQAEELLDIYHQGEFEKAKWNEIQTRIETADAIEQHIEVLKKAFDVESIRGRKLTVAVDCCNGACSLLTPRWLAELGCATLTINDDISAPFPHHPEPKRETMAQLRAIVKAGRADIGFALDADGERLGVVTETGEPLSEEMTLALAADIKLSRFAGQSSATGVVVTNISTTRNIEKIAGRYHSEVIRVPVGSAYISEAIVENNALIGGEGNGAVAIPEIHATNDSAAAIGLILEQMARTGKKASELVANLPRSSMLKHYVQVEPNLLFSVLNDVREAAEKANSDEVDLSDGIKLSWPDGWVHVRASNTESMIRVIAEAENERRAGELMDWARDRLKQT